MKIIISSIIMLVLSALFVAAGNIYPVDFSQQEEKTFDLVEKEGIEFLPIKGILILENIKDDGGIDMKLVLPDGRVWGLLPLKKLAPVNIDVDRDNDNDISVLYLETNGDKAKLTVREIRDDVTQVNSDIITKEENTINNNQESSVVKVTGSAVRKTSSTTIGILIVIGIAVVGVLIYFLFARGKTSFGSYQ